MLHTIQEAIALTGKSRRTIYYHCDKGLISWTFGDDGKRYFETSELIRVYGRLKKIAQPEKETVQEIAQDCTPDCTPSEISGTLTEATALRLAAAVEKLIELGEKKLLLLEHKPAEPLSASTEKPSVQAEASSSEAKVKASKPSASSFADLLKSFE